MKKNYRPMSRQDEKAVVYKKKTINPSSMLEVLIDDDNLENVDDYYKTAESVLKDEDITADIADTSIFTDEDTLKDKSWSEGLSSDKVDSLSNQLNEDRSNQNVENLSDDLINKQKGECSNDENGGMNNIEVGNSIAGVDCIGNGESSSVYSESDYYELHKEENVEEEALNGSNKKKQSSANKAPTKVNLKKLKSCVESEPRKSNRETDFYTNELRRNVQGQSTGKKENKVTQLVQQLHIRKKRAMSICPSKLTLTPEQSPVRKTMKTVSKSIRNKNDEEIGITSIDAIYRGRSTFEPLLSKEKIECTVLFLNINASIDNEEATVDLLALVIRGSGKLTIDKESFVLKKNSVALITRGSRYSLMGTGKSGCCIYMCYSTAGIK